MITLLQLGVSLFSLFQNTIAGNLFNPKNQSLDKGFFSDKYIIIWLQSTKEKLNNLSVHSLVNLEKTGFANKG